MNYCPYCMEPISGEYSFCTHCGKSKSHNAPAHHLLPGTMLQNRYQIGAALGEGGFGITYIGRDVNLDMIVAVKEYFPNGYVSRSNKLSATIDQPTTTDRKEFFEKGCEKFLQEARVLAKFSSEPGIVNVRDFFEANNTAYIVMEYLKGETLKEQLKRRKKLEPNEALGILMPVMASLKKVHADGLIHRDISPDNIMLVQGDAKLLDFGAARDISAMGNKSLSIMLKPGYAPAEQYRTHGEQGPWTDVYALCATIYKCITGITPDDSIDRNFQDTLKTPSSLGIAIAPAVEAAIIHGLSVDHRNRYQNIDELLDGFKGVPPKSTLGGEGTVVIPKGMQNSQPTGNNSFQQPQGSYGAQPQMPNARPQRPIQQPPQRPVQQPPQRPIQQPVAPRPQQVPYQQAPYNNGVQRPTQPVAPAPVATAMLNRAAFSTPPSVANFSASQIWAPLAYVVLAILCALYNCSTMGVIAIAASTVCCALSAIALQVKAVPILAKIARWFDFAFLALIPLFAILAPNGLWEYWSYSETEYDWMLSLVLFIAQFAFALAGIASYYKRIIKQSFATTVLNSSRLSGALAALIIISLTSAFYMPLIDYQEILSVQLVCRLIVWVIPTLAIMLPEKHIPNAIWLVFKIVSIIFVVIYSLIFFEGIIYMLTGEYVTGYCEGSHLIGCYYELELSEYEHFTYFPNIFYAIVPLVFEILYFAAMIFNIDISHSSIFRKRK